MPGWPFVKRLACDTRALALTEFAFACPVVLTLGLFGLETSNLAITHMKVSQAAMHIADDASRIGDASALAERKIYEHEIIDLLIGSDLQMGAALDLFEHGRVVISSQEVDPDDTAEVQQYIHWQRCMGKHTFASAYGDEGTGKGDPDFKGMGPSGEEVYAFPAGAVIFVEVAYEYQPLITDSFIDTKVIRSYSSFTVRNDRDLTEIYQKDPNNPIVPATCDKFERFRKSEAEATKTGGWNWEF